MARYTLHYLLSNKVNSSSSSLINGQTVSNPKGTTEHFNKCFISIGTKSQKINHRNLFSQRLPKKNKLKFSLD